MKNFKWFSLRKSKGFTLIELLIVIALLGALAVGLLAALDPFEQLKKGTDTGVRNTVSEVQGAIFRYYAIKSQMPWCANDTCSTLEAGFTTDAPVLLSNNTATLQKIINTGELKTDFATLAGTVTLGKITLFGNNTAGTIQVCYKPTAKSFVADPNTKFNATTGASTCVADPNPAVNTCLWCVK